MGLLSALRGNASEVDIQELATELGGILTDDEQIERAFKVIRDLFVFTNKRFILVDKQGLTGKKVTYHTFPYKAITHFEVETAGRFDADCELRIWISGWSQPISKEIQKGTDIIGLQKVLAEFVLK